MRPPKVNTKFVANRLDYIFTEVLNLTIYGIVVVIAVYIITVIMSRPSVDPWLNSVIGNVANLVLYGMVCFFPLVCVIALVGWLSGVGKGDF